jgi:DNA-binding IclR family transcriptional regulator
MQRDSGAPWDGAPWEVHAIAAPVLHADDAVAALAVSLPAAKHATAARPRWPRITRVATALMRLLDYRP